MPIIAETNGFHHNWSGASATAGNAVLLHDVGQYRLLALQLGVARLIAPLTEGEQPTNSETTTMDVVPASPACAHMALTIPVRLIAAGGTLHSFKDSALHQQLKRMDSLTAKWTMTDVRKHHTLQQQCCQSSGVAAAPRDGVWGNGEGAEELTAPSRQVMYL